MQITREVEGASPSLWCNRRAAAAAVKPQDEHRPRTQQRYGEPLKHVPHQRRQLVRHGQQDALVANTHTAH